MGVRVPPFAPSSKPPTSDQQEHDIGDRLALGRDHSFDTHRIAEASSADHFDLEEIAGARAVAWMEAR